MSQSASEKLAALDEAMTAGPWYAEDREWPDAPSILRAVEGAIDSRASAHSLATLRNALPAIRAHVEATEREGSGVAIIRTLGFIGNSHYCPDCMNHFHDSCGQHEPGCSVLAGLLEDEEWFDPQPFTSLAALEEALS